MNKQDIAGFKKQFKADNHLIDINEIHTTQVIRGIEEDSITKSDSTSFNRLDDKSQDFIFTSAKKALTGKIGEKLYELDFEEKESNELGMKVFKSIVEGRNVVSEIAKLEQLFADTIHGDFVSNIIIGTYHKPTSNKQEDEGDSSSYDFILGMISPYENPKDTFTFNNGTNQIQSILSDTRVIANAPIESFLYPVIEDDFSNFSKVIYSNKKANTINSAFVSESLGATIVLTGKEEKSHFRRIIATVLGEQATPKKLQEIYENFYLEMSTSDEKELNKFGKRDILRVLKNSNVDGFEKIEDIFDEVVGIDGYELTGDNMLPRLSPSSLKVEMDGINVSTSPENIKNIEKIVSNGETYIQIKIDDLDVFIDGLEVK